MTAPLALRTLLVFRLVLVVAFVQVRGLLGAAVGLIAVFGHRLRLDGACSLARMPTQ